MEHKMEIILGGHPYVGIIQIRFRVCSQPDIIGHPVHYGKYIKIILCFDCSFV